MANYQRCKIRVYPCNGKIKLDSFKEKVEQLKIENNIYETINISHSHQLNFAEIRFTAKRYPSMISEIFAPDENDLWIINSDEGGSSDYIRFETQQKELFSGFHEKAIYSFDEIRLLGNPKLIEEKIEEIFGAGIKYINKHEIENGIKIYLNCLYTGNSFFHNDDEGKIRLESFDLEIKEEFKNETGEFWDMLFHVDGIKFKENFYKSIQQRPTGIKDFEYLDKIEFYDKKRLTNKIEWTKSSAYGYWRHSSNDGFLNCGNSKFYAYELYENFKKNGR